MGGCDGCIYEHGCVPFWRVTLSPPVSLTPSFCAACASPKSTKPRPQPRRTVPPLPTPPGFRKWLVGWSVVVALSSKERSPSVRRSPIVRRTSVLLFVLSVLCFVLSAVGRFRPSCLVSFLVSFLVSVVSCWLVGHSAFGLLVASSLGVRYSVCSLLV